MKTKFTLFSCLYLSLFFSGLAQSDEVVSPLPAGISRDWYSNASAYVRQMEYDFYPGVDHFRAKRIVWNPIFASSPSRSN
jgi:hypothetical protein